MANCKRKACWLLLLTLLYTAAWVLSIGQTQARYETVLTRQTLVEGQSSGVSSDYLVTREDAPMTVLVGELSMYSSTKISFHLTASGEDAVGKLAWGLRETEYEEYLDLSMLSGYDVLEGQEELALLRDVPMELTLTIRPTEVARTTAHEALKLHVLVTWGKDLWGTFQVMLPEVKGEESGETPAEPAPPETPEEPEEPEKTETPGKDTEAPENPGNEDGPGNDEETGNNEETDNNGDSGDNGELQNDEDNEDNKVSPNSEETDNNEDPEDSKGPDNSEDPEGSKEPDNNEEPKDNGESKEPEKSEEPETPAEPAKPGIHMESLESFDMNQLLPLKLTLSEEVTAIRLGLWQDGVLVGETMTDPSITSLPAGTRFSLNGGKSYYMLYSGKALELSNGSLTSLNLLLDLSCTGLNTKKELVLGMEAYAGENLLKRCALTVKADAVAAKLMVPEGTGEASGRILTRGSTLTLELPMDWKQAQMEQTLEILTLNAAGESVYETVNLNSSAWKMEIVSDEKTHSLQLQPGQTLPQAGTYRLTITWRYEAICYARTQTTFFINYAVQPDAALSSSEVPKND